MSDASLQRLRYPAWLRPAPDSAVARLRAAGRAPRLQALNLLWSFWVFITPAFSGVDAGFWWSLGLSYPVFLLLFLLSFVRPAREAGAWAGAMAVLAGLSVPWNPGAWTYGVFACAIVPYERSVVASVCWIVLIQTSLLLEVRLLHWPWYVLLMVVCVCSSVGLGSLAGRVSSRKDIELRLSHEEVRRLAATAERERIGRDLHDLLGHTLSLITLKLELSRKLFDRDHDAARRELEEAERVARHALAEVRSAVSGIRATDLAEELASARLLLESSLVRLECAPLPPALPAEIEHGLALVLREAVTNIARHAQATQARLALTVEGERLRLQVEDNGRGGVGACGNGLAGMRERVQAMGGTMHIDSPPRQGTRLCIEVPLPPQLPREPGGVSEPVPATPIDWLPQPGRVA
ncbi:MAG: hypothetical protein BGP10_12120 [Rhodanobacter sp. 68-29]|nr:sensor histidine kinase [Rhodanobacter sp.]ODV27939.1 MAG: hypothetical protein ABT19_00040 [Rhodanobacter sp. SCN 68-63]OJY60643.1 MAG: hypothetical protein BGP10_12120 [Rhodanobacter sp. 68-29]